MLIQKNNTKFEKWKLRDEVIEGINYEFSQYNLVQ